MQIMQSPPALIGTRLKRANSWRAAFFLALSLGCAKRIDFGPSGEVRSAEELLRLIDLAERQVTSVKGEARLRVSSPRRGGTLNLFVAVAEPDNLHLEALNFFGKPQSILVSSRMRFELLDSDAGKYFRGPASQENLSRFMPVVVPVPELVMMLLGRAPRIIASSASLTLDASSRSYILRLSSNGVEQTLWVDPASHRVIRSQMRGRIAYELSFDDFVDAASTQYPRKSTLVVPSADSRLELKYRDLEVNPRLDSSLFELPPPPGVAIIELDEAGNSRSHRFDPGEQTHARFGHLSGRIEERR